MRDKVTAPMVRAAKGGEKIGMITAYDASAAHIVDRAGADIILVGDSLANVVLGHPSTLRVTLDQMIHHTAAVARAAPRAVVVGDMPWMSFHVTPDRTVVNAGRMVQEGGAEAVKLEGGRQRLPMIEAVLDAEIPVMGHIGLTPQSVNAMGGYRVQGREIEAARDLLADAVALSDAGVFSIVLEGVPDELAALITEEIPVPTIGIGAGPDCDGQVLVYHDVLGLHDGRLPRFVRKYAELGDIAADAVERFFTDVRKGEFPGDGESYRNGLQVAAALREELRSAAD